MTQKHAVLPYVPLESGTAFREPPRVPVHERLNAPALRFMTDFNETIPATIGPDVPIDRALETMRRAGVRLLLVVDDERRIIGKITSMEIEGEEPVALAQERRVARSAIQVKDIMTPQSEVQVLSYASVAGAEVGHVVATLNYLKLKHLLVVEPDPDSQGQVVRGVFSRARIGAELRMNLNLVEVGRQTLGQMAHNKS